LAAFWLGAACPALALDGDTPRPGIPRATASDLVDYFEYTRTHTVGNMAFPLTN